MSNRLTLVELLNFNLAFEQSGDRTVMGMEELVSYAGLDEAAKVFDALMSHQSYSEEDFTYSLTDDPITPIVEIEHDEVTGPTTLTIPGIKWYCGLTVDTELTVEADDPKQAAMKVFALHDTMTPEDYRVFDAASIGKDVFLEPDDKDEARRAYAAGEYFEEVNLGAV